VPAGLHRRDGPDVGWAAQKEKQWECKQQRDGLQGLPWAKLAWAARKNGRRFCKFSLLQILNLKPKLKFKSNAFSNSNNFKPFLKT
jgi:hypothetical protein